MPPTPDGDALERGASPSPGARIVRAVILSIGSEIVVGETRDTNAGEIARSLSLEGVDILRLLALPDDLDAVRDGFAAGARDADLVVSTGGLGPTPDDLTREAIAAVLGETPRVDEGQERWLRALWARRHIPFPEANLKQAWLIPSAAAIANPNGTAPGWWVDAPRGILVAMPGPPREMRAMWTEQVLPRLRERGLGRLQATRTYRLAGIGESQVAERLGEALLRGRNPVVATYARADAVDVRISAVDEAATNGSEGRSADSILEATEAVVLSAIGDHVWARGDETWPAAIGRRLETRGWDLSIVEVGTGGTLLALLGDPPWLHAAEALKPDSRAVRSVRGDTSGGAGDAEPTRPDGAASEAAELSLRVLAGALARDSRHRAGSDVGLAVIASAQGQDTAVTVAIADPAGEFAVRRMAFLGGAQGRSRAALTAAAELLERLDATGRLAENLKAEPGEIPR